MDGWDSSRGIILETLPITHLILQLSKLCHNEWWIFSTLCDSLLHADHSNSHKSTNYEIGCGSDCVQEVWTVRTRI